MNRKYRLLPLLLAFVMLFCACTSDVPQETSPAAAIPANENPDISPWPSPASIEPGEILQVIIFDVGQADCALVKTGEHAMLIDAGNMGQDSLILGYLAEHGVTKLDYAVVTHPHADHIGSMSAVVSKMDSINTLLMPDVIHTTKTFERLLDAIEAKNIQVTIPEPGETFEMGNVLIRTLAPNSADYDDLNDYSIVLRIEYGQSGFLFTGDAEEISENEQLRKGFNVSADVLKVGHHGSNSSTTQRYLDAVSPSYAVISCGKGNSYGHPSSNIVSRLTGRGVTLYRTDVNGTVTFETDGNTITAKTGRKAGFNTPIAATPEDTPDSTVLYIGNKNSKVFHLPTCKYLPMEKNQVYFPVRSDAISGKYRPCQKCNP